MTEEKTNEKKEKAEEKNNKIYRFPDEAWLGGVCAGIAYKFKIQSWIPRLAWTLAVLIYGVGILPYILCWIFIPPADTPEDYDDVCG